MEQDISVRTMMLTVEYEDQIPKEYQGFIKKYLSMIYAVGFDAGRIDAMSEFGKKKTAVLQRDCTGNRIAQYESVIMASKSSGTTLGSIWRALKSHKLTKRGYYWDKVA
jgi:hypothetical protein